MPSGSGPTPAAPVLRIAGLRLAFGRSEVLHGVSLHVRAGEKVALVGESGSGKSTIARVVLGLLQHQRGTSVAGSVQLGGEEIADGGAAIRRARGTRVSLILQDPVGALNPAFTVRDQFREVLRRADRTLSGAAADARARALLADVALDDADRVLASYVFQLSGGMNQRVMIALALANHPQLVVADEPGSALDVTVQARTLRLMDALAARRGAGVLFISHNLGAVREFADRVYVIYRGRIVEHATAAQLFAAPRHPYTRALLAAVPRLDVAELPDVPERSEAFADPLIEHPGCAEPAAA